MQDEIMELRRCANRLLAWEVISRRIFKKIQKKIIKGAKKQGFIVMPPFNADDYDEKEFLRLLDKKWEFMERLAKENIPCE
jgi:hypothetical protein